MSGRVIKNDGAIPGTQMVSGRDYEPKMIHKGGMQEYPEMAFVYQKTMPAGYSLTPAGTDAWAANPLILNAPGGGYWVRWWPDRGPGTANDHPQPPSITIDWANDMMPEAYATGGTPHGSGLPSGRPLLADNGNAAGYSSSAWFYPAKLSWSKPPPSQKIVVNGGRTGFSSVTLRGYEYAYRNSTRPSGDATANYKAVGATTVATGWLRVPIEPRSLRKAAGHSGPYRAGSGSQFLIAYVRAVYSDGSKSGWATTQEHSPYAKDPVLTVNYVTQRSWTSWYGIQYTYGGYSHHSSKTSPGLPNVLVYRLTASKTNTPGHVCRIGVESGPFSAINEEYAKIVGTAEARTWNASKTINQIGNATAKRTHQNYWNTVLHRYATASTFSKATRHGSYMYVISGGAHFYLQYTASSSGTGSYYRNDTRVSSSTTSSPPSYGYKYIGVWRPPRPCGGNAWSSYRQSAVSAGAILLPNGDFDKRRWSYNTRWKPGQWVQVNGFSPGGVSMVKYSAFGLYGGKSEFFNVVDKAPKVGSYVAHNTTASTSTAATHSHTTYERAGTKHGPSSAGERTRTGVERIGPTSGGFPVSMAGNPGWFHASSTQRINRVTFAGTGSPYVPGHGHFVAQVSKDGRTWFTVGFTPNGKSGIQSISFGRQPPGMYYRIAPNGIGWASSRGHSGPKANISAVLWYAGG